IVHWPPTETLAAILSSTPSNCLALPTFPTTSVVPVIGPSLPCPERSFISPEPVRVSMSYARGGSPTVRVNPEVRVIVPSVAWTLTTYVPAGVLDEVARVRFEVLVGLPVGGVNVHVAPAGNPVQEYWTLWVGPEVRWAVTVTFTDPPCTATKPEEGLLDREKSNGGTNSTRRVGRPALDSLELYSVPS